MLEHKNLFAFPKFVLSDIFWQRDGFLIRKMRGNFQFWAKGLAVS